MAKSTGASIASNAIRAATNVGKAAAVAAKMGVDAVSDARKASSASASHAAQESHSESSDNRNDNGSNSNSSRAAGVAQMVAGGAIAAVGVPMLILPGPGVAAIAGGATLAANGARKAFGIKEKKAKAQHPSA